MTTDRGVTESELIAMSDCVVCGERATRHPAVTLKYGSIATCRTCGSGLLDPRPLAADLGALHSTDDYFNHPYFEARRQMTPAQMATAETRLAKLSEIAGSLAGLRLLDVGCDVGLFVDHAAKVHGVASFGVDIVPRVVEIGREAGRNLRVGTLEGLKLPAGSLDVITAFDLIEHVDDPKDFVREAMRVLRPGGLLYLETPNYDGLIYRFGRLLGQLPAAAVVNSLQERLWPPFHVQYFTAESLRRLAEDVGLEPLDIAGRELSGSELAVEQPLLRTAVRTVFAVSTMLKQYTLISAVLRRPTT